MQLPSEFIRLPLAFDAQRLAEEALQFEPHQWEYHPQGYQGNSALILVSANGGNNNDYTGPMQPTELLKACPYIQQVMAAFETVVGRTRLMRLDPGTSVPEHSDTDYSWRNRVRIHIPIVTDPNVSFTSVGNATVHMKSGEAWVFDNWKTHAVYNNSDVQRIHLVMDTTGTSNFWAKVRAGFSEPSVAMRKQVDQTHGFQKDKETKLVFENHNATGVRNADEMKLMCDDFVRLLAVKSLEKTFGGQFMLNATDFVDDWRSLWLQYADSGEGLAEYEALARRFIEQAKTSLNNITLLGNDLSAPLVLESWLENCCNLDELERRAQRAPGQNYSLNAALYDRPIFIVAAPRSGSTMFFELLKQNNDLWTIGDESHVDFESIRELHPASNGFASNALNAENLNEDVANALLGSFLRKLQNARGTIFSQIAAEMQPSRIRFLEKTPKNALRIPFLKALFPNARFIYLYRDAHQNIGSIIDAWQSGRFVTYPKLPGWSGPPWSLLLVEGWQELRTKSVAEIAVHQWCASNRHIADTLSMLPEEDWFAVNYQDLLSNRERTLRAVCEFADLPFGPKMQQIGKEAMPHSKYTLSAPSKDKWRRHEVEMRPHEEKIIAAQQRLNQFLIGR